MVNIHSTRILVNFASLRKTLKQDYHYSEMEFLHTVWRLMNALDEIKISFANWFNDDVTPHLDCEDISWEELVSKRGLNPYNAFLFMDTMKKEPAQGMIMLKGQMHPSLRLGIDELRPDLRATITQKMAYDNSEKSIKTDSEGNIDLK